MKVYNYDSSLYNFTLEEEGTPDPLEPEKTLLPAFATFEPPPPCGADQVACFINGSWVCLANHLGQVFWTADGQETTMLVYGDLPQGASLTPPPNTAAQNKNIASSLLYQTDWTTIPDVADPARSNPYLANSQEYIAYRNAIRQIAINPVAGDIDWPTQPQAVWATT
jgi:hypothetical protein